jgi:hypothetical protein
MEARNEQDEKNQNNLNQLLEKIQGGVGTIKGQLAQQYVESLAQIATGSIPHN